MTRYLLLKKKSAHKEGRLLGVKQKYRLKNAACRYLLPLTFVSSLP